MSAQTRYAGIDPVVERYFALGLDHKGVALGDYVADQNGCEAMVALMDRIRSVRSMARMTSNGHVVAVQTVRRTANG